MSRLFEEPFSDAPASAIKKDPAEAGSVYLGLNCMWRNVQHLSTTTLTTVATIRDIRGAAQCTASLFAAATAFFGSVSSSTPSLYFAWAVASSISWPSENARSILP